MLLYALNNPEGDSVDEEEHLEEKEKPAPSAKRLPLISVAALTLSILALMVSVLEVSAIREDQRVQVWPYMAIASSFGPNGYALEAINKGIGPARVRTMEVLFDGEPVDNIDELIVETVGEEDAFSYDLYRTSNIAQSVMSADEKATLFAVPWDDRTRRLSSVWHGRISVRVCYCSVYDECWLSKLDAGEPESVAKCPVPAATSD